MPPGGWGWGARWSGEAGARDEAAERRHNLARGASPWNSFTSAPSPGGGIGKPLARRQSRPVLSRGGGAWKSCLSGSYGERHAKWRAPVDSAGAFFISVVHAGGLELGHGQALHSSRDRWCYLRLADIAPHRCTRITRHHPVYASDVGRGRVCHRRSLNGAGGRDLPHGTARAIPTLPDLRKMYQLPARAGDWRACPGCYVAPPGLAPVIAAFQGLAPLAKLCRRSAARL